MIAYYCMEARRAHWAMFVGQQTSVSQSQPRSRPLSAPRIAATRKHRPPRPDNSVASPPSSELLAVSIVILSKHLELFFKLPAQKEKAASMIWSPDLSSAVTMGAGNSRRKPAASASMTNVARMTFGANIPPPKAGYFILSLKPDKIKVSAANRLIGELYNQGEGPWGQRRLV